MAKRSDPATADSDQRPSVIVIGNFDGVHRGHAALIEHARGAAPDARLIAVTFWPHPMSIIRPDRAPKLLISLDRRKELLVAAGVDEVVVVEFTAEVAGWSPKRFIDTVVRPLNPTAIVVGENFRFGFRAAGDVRTLAELGAGDFVVEVLPLISTGSEPSSSTSIREALAQGDVERVTQLSERRPQLRGPVVHGDHRGRLLGFPTANVEVDPILAVPADGVYAGWLIRLDTGVRWPAAISVGTNPTFDGDQRRVEAHVLDRDDLDLYGVEVVVEFVELLRGQAKFADVNALIEQMNADIDQARSLLTGGEESTASA